MIPQSELICSKCQSVCEQGAFSYFVRMKLFPKRAISPSINEAGHAFKYLPNGWMMWKKLSFKSTNRQGQTSYNYAKNKYFCRDCGLSMEKTMAEKAHEIERALGSDDTERLKHIGQELDSFGGLDLMQITAYHVLGQTSRASELNDLWHGIGSWMC